MFLYFWNVICQNEYRAKFFMNRNNISCNLLNKLVLEFVLSSTLWKRARRKIGTYSVSVDGNYFFFSSVISFTGSARKIMTTSDNGTGVEWFCEIIDKSVPSTDGFVTLTRYSIYSDEYNGEFGFKNDPNNKRNNI